MRIRHLGIAAIVTLALGLSACAGGAGAGTQSESGAASGGGDSSASASSAASGAEDSSAGQSGDGADSALSADSATSSAASARTADTPASAPSAAGSQSGQAPLETVDASTVLEFTHIPEGYEEAPAQNGGLGYKKGEEQGFLAMVGNKNSLPPGLSAVDALKYSHIDGIDPSSVKEGEKVTGDGVEFQTVHAVITRGEQKLRSIFAVAERDDQLVMILFVAPDQGEELPEIDPALVKSVVEGIKWK